MNTHNHNHLSPPVPARRSPADYQKPDTAFQLGAYDGQLGVDMQGELLVIANIFEYLKEEARRQALETRHKLSARKTTLAERLRNWRLRLNEARARLIPPEEAAFPFSVITAAVYTVLGFIFFLGEVGILMDTVANALGLPIDWEEMTLSDPSSYAGLMLSLALAGIPFVSVKLWMDHYVMEPLLRGDARADRWFRRLFFPVAVLSIALAFANGVLRWVFQAPIMDPMLYDRWMTVFEIGGKFSPLGMIFMILLVVVVFLVGGISLSVGLTHLKGFFKSAGNKLKSALFRRKRGRFEKQVEEPLLEQIAAGLGELAAIESQLASLKDELEARLAALEKQRELIEQAYEAGYQVGVRRREALQTQQTYLAEEAARREQQIQAAANQRQQQWAQRQEALEAARREAEDAHLRRRSPADALQDLLRNA